MGCPDPWYGPCVDNTPNMPAIIGGVFGGLVGLIVLVGIVRTCVQSAEYKARSGMPRASRDVENVSSRYEINRASDHAPPGHHVAFIGGASAGGDSSGAAVSGGDGGASCGGGGDGGGGGGGGC